MLSSMTSTSQALEEARAELKLPLDRFAEVIGVSLEDLERAQRGDVGAGRNALLGASEVFGVEMSEFMDGGATGRPSTMLLRSFIDHADPATFEELVHRGVHRELGRLVRHVRRKAWLRDALGVLQSKPPFEIPVESRPIAEGSRPPHGADQLAALVRARLGLDERPVPCMLELARDHLGIDVQFTHSLWERIDGASISIGSARCILVNLARRGSRWWRTRTTIAHELCHLCFDGGLFAGTPGGPLVIFSPAAGHSGPRRQEPRFGQRHSIFLNVEQRANAFAAYFLAPPGAVKALFAHRTPARTSETVEQVAHHFGLSPLTAVNVLTNVYGWSDQERYDLIDESEGLPLESSHPDVVSEVPSEDAELRRLADEAVDRGALFRSTRDRWLGAVSQEQRPESTLAVHPAAPDARRIAAEIRDLVAAAQTDAALRVLWDALDRWIGDRDFDRCLILIDDLRPVDVNSHVMVSLLAATGRAPELADARTAYRCDARRVLQASGRTPEDVDALLGEEHLGVR